MPQELFYEFPELEFIDLLRLILEKLDVFQFFFKLVLVIQLKNIGEFLDGNHATIVSIEKGKATVNVLIGEDRILVHCPCHEFVVVDFSCSINVQVFENGVDLGIFG